MFPARRFFSPSAVLATAGVLVAAVGALVAASLPAAAPAVAAPPEPGTYVFTNAGSDLCLDVPGDSGSAGVQLIQSACDDQGGQHWRSTSGGALIATINGLCAGVRDGETEAGTPVLQESCTGAASQQWRLVESGDAYRVINVNSGRCLNTKSNSTSSGAGIVQNSCDSVATKQWLVTPVDGGDPDPTPTEPDPTPTEPDPTPTDPPPGGPSGFASVNAHGQNGTTGGADGPTRVVTDAAGLDAALTTEGPLNIEVRGMISLSGMHDVTSDKTVYGVGSSSGLTGGGLDVGDCGADSPTHPEAVHNVIIRNLNFRNADDDSINVQCYSHHVWIDHNDLADASDGLTDIKRGSNYITVSWNHYHDHDHTCLLGHSDGNGDQDRGRLKVTYDHNWFDGTFSRNPRVRFGNPVHVFNNYYLNNEGVGVACQREGGCFVEGNYFENVDEPMTNDWAGDYQGSIVERDNVFVNSGDPAGIGGGVENPASYYSYNTDDPSSVKAIVTAGAGVGKV